MNIALYNLTRTRSLHTITTMKSALCLVALVMLASLTTSLTIGETFEDSNMHVNYYCGRSLSRALAIICYSDELREALTRRKRSINNLRDCCDIGCTPKDLASYC